MSHLIQHIVALTTFADLFPYLYLLPSAAANLCVTVSIVQEEILWWPVTLTLPSLLCSILHISMLIRQKKLSSRMQMQVRIIIILFCVSLVLTLGYTLFLIISCSNLLCRFLFYLFLSDLQVVRMLPEDH